MATRQPKVFISYRREDAGGYAGWIHQSLVRRVGEENVSMDLTFTPGSDFVDQIRRAVGACDVMLVIIGPRWATISLDGHRPRLEEPDDFVRLEVVTALQRSDLTVIPVLVGGAKMPAPAALPSDAEPLSRRHAFEIADTRWDYDIEQLLELVDPHRRHTMGPGLLLLTGLATAFAAACLADLVVDALLPEPRDYAGDAAAAIAVARRTLAWALVGITLAVWLAMTASDGRNAVSRGLTGLVLGALAGALGGALYSAPELTDDAITGSWRETAALAATGGLVGVLLGAGWTHRHIAFGCAAGAGAGALTEAVTAIPSSAPEFALRVTLICGLVLLALAALDLERRAPQFFTRSGARGNLHAR